LAKISERLGATAIVVEGKEAGGHLGTDTSVRNLIPDIHAAV
jgi:NAD(P)H-dependent flavin oxidoreductase YrpB (nitropropane dioxygenase family)